LFKKNRLWVIMLIVFMMFAVVAGCTQSQETPKEENSAGEQAQSAGNREVILATTTSTVDSGLLDVLKPKFDAETGYDLTVVSVGTGAALAMGERGEADALLVHAPASEIP